MYLLLFYLLTHDFNIYYLYQDTWVFNVVVNIAKSLRFVWAFPRSPKNPDLAPYILDLAKMINESSQVIFGWPNTETALNQRFRGYTCLYNSLSHRSDDPWVRLRLSTHTNYGVYEFISQVHWAVLQCEWYGSAKSLSSWRHLEIVSWIA